MKIQQFEIKIVEAIADHGNFRTNFHWKGPEDFIHIYYLPRILLPDDDCHVGSVFWEDYVAFSTSPAGSYSSYEKLFFPFDTFTWCCILGTFVCAFMVIFIVSRMSREVQILVFGENVKSPAVNVTGLFFGMGQTSLPLNNFARFILMIYIMYCMIINTAFHGEYKSQSVI